jgi:3D (Asp-Asp-Asp) domain-containing protein
MSPGIRFAVVAIPAALLYLVSVHLAPALAYAPSLSNVNGDDFHAIADEPSISPASFKSIRRAAAPSLLDETDHWTSFVDSREFLAADEPEEPMTIIGNAWLASPFRITAYCLPGVMSNGRPVHHGAVAADASIFPLGTTIEIEDLGIFVVEDRFGWDARQYRLDVWTQDCDDAWRIGVRYRQVRTLGVCPFLTRQKPATTSLKAIDEMLSFIATQRLDVSEFSAANGRSMESIASLMREWLRSDDEDLITTATNDPLALACALSWAARQG